MSAIHILLGMGICSLFTTKQGIEIRNDIVSAIHNSFKIQENKDGNKTREV